MTDGRLDCGHEAVAGYAVTFTVGGEGCGDDADADDITSACDMVAAVVETEVEDADAVGCGVEDCPHYHERVAEELRRDAERHSGNPYA